MEKTVFINMSNHPSTGWTKKQREAAEIEFCSSGKAEIVDIKFPDIDPTWDSFRLDDKVKEVFKEIQAIKGMKIIHVMGEMGFTCKLVAMCNIFSIASIHSPTQGKDMDIIRACVHSTTQRKVTEIDGKKIVEFEFVRFRYY